jgi:hypothetical protein
MYPTWGISPSDDEAIMRLSEIFDLGLPGDRNRGGHHIYHRGTRKAIERALCRLPIRLPNCGSMTLSDECHTQYDTGLRVATLDNGGVFDSLGAVSSARADVRPISVRVPQIKAESSLVEMGLQADGTPEVPSLDVPAQAAWFGYGVKPGDVGSAVIFGHRDGYGELGVFFRLGDVSVGETVHVGESDGSMLTFKVRDVEQMPKIGFEREKVAKVYEDVDHPALRIVTCGGRFVGGELGYEDNIVVFADLA